MIPYVNENGSFLNIFSNYILLSLREKEMLKLKSGRKKNFSETFATPQRFRNPPGECKKRWRKVFLLTSFADPSRISAIKFSELYNNTENILDGNR